MCIIMYAKSGQTIKKEKIETAFKNNPDGAGVMWYDLNGKVHYHKGFDNVKKLVSFFNRLGSKTPRAIHCRIATSGKVSTRTCHPFPITDSFDVMGVEKGETKYGCVMHNGIFSLYTPKEGMNADYSDSMNYVKETLFPLAKAGCIQNEGVINLLSEMSSRLLIFLPDFMVARFGSWVEDKEEKFLASNDTYEHERYIYRYPAYYTGYDNPQWYSTSSSSSATTTYTNMYKPTGERKAPTHSFSIMFFTDDKIAACDMVEDFLYEYRGLIDDEDTAIETLQQVDDGVYEFYFDSYGDIEQFKKVREPFYITGVEKLNGKS